MCKSIEKMKNVIAILLDLAKTFDTISHEIFLVETENCGLCGIALSWLNTYLTDKQQIVQIDNCTYELFHKCK